MVLMFLFTILWDLFSKGWPAISWSFVGSLPKDAMTKGGILPAIMGTVLLTLITALLAVPLGVCCAVYLNEYARNTWLTRLIRACIRNLSGVPSVIYGLFGLALFVQGMHLGTSMLSAGFTLGLLSLPYIISTAEEALRRIPASTREAALGVGATQFETIRDIVLPTALPGILTGVVLALSRAAGETAPIFFTGVAFYITGPSGYQPGVYGFALLPVHAEYTAPGYRTGKATRLRYSTRIGHGSTPP